MITVIIVDTEVKWIVKVMKGVMGYMAEKRFKNNGSLIFDNTTPLTTFEVVDKLNELAEENEQSKMMIATLQNIVLENEDLEKENKELKLQLEAFKDKLCELGVSDVKLYGKRYYTGLEE